ncbi:MAG: sulfotransferase [Chitinophagales bacterium]|nr:sulfotransferase domain-containing protein [Chitinophagales bacterium]MDW8393335.1 sulfotransferase [Chitinophagales bacterium]
MNPYPSFYVVGAPKSGTTSLYHYLRSHPQLFLPRRKELLYFCTDLHFRFPLLSTDQFLSYYRGASPHRLAGEVSVWNLLSAEAPRRIGQSRPDARIIALLRSPADMLHSLFQNHVFNRNENLTDFAAALDAEGERRKGKNISPVIRCPLEGLFYSEVARYAGQLRRYYAVFPRDHVLVIFFEDFAADPAGVYRSVLQFLQVDDRHRPEFRVYNARKTVRSTWLRDWMVGAPAAVRRLTRWLLPHHSKARDWLEQWLWQVNTRKVDAPKLEVGLRNRIISLYRDDIRDLETLTGRDLSHWLR